MKKYSTLSGILLTVLLFSHAGAQVVWKLNVPANATTQNGAPRFAHVGWQYTGVIQKIDGGAVTLDVGNQADGALTLQTDANTQFTKDVDHALQPGTLADFKVGQKVTVNGTGAELPKPGIAAPITSMQAFIDYHDSLYHYSGPIRTIDVPEFTIELNADVDRPTPYSKIYHSYCDFSADEKTEVVIDGKLAKLEDLKKDMPVYITTRLVPGPDGADRALALKIVTPVPPAATQPAAGAGTGYSAWGK